jgi:hypothetical protein
MRHRNLDATALMSNVGHFGLGTVGLLLVAISAWGGIVPFLGPSFGYSADGAGSWHWSLTHAVVALAPGAIGVVVGLIVIASSRGLVVGRGRVSLAGAGLIVLVCGAWFAFAPWAWPVVDNTGTYFVAATPLRALANIAGYALGPGLIVASCGAFFMGWAIRHQDTGVPMLSNQTVAPPTVAPPVENQTVATPATTPVQNQTVATPATTPVQNQTIATPPVVEPEQKV